MFSKLSKQHSKTKFGQNRINFQHKKLTQFSSKTKKNQRGGLFDHSKEVIPLPSTEYNPQTLELVGEGGFGVLAMGETESGQFAIKLIKSISQCGSAKAESSIHNEVYQTYLEFAEYAHNNPAYQLLYIPQPLSYQEFPLRIVQIGEKKFETRCSYTMEYMSPIDIGNNIHDGQPIQLHVAYALKQGFIEENPYRGYMIGMGKLDSLLQHLNELYPNKKQPTSSTQIYEAIGIAVGCAIFGSGHNPIDFQFMISEYNGEFRLIGFDFGMFTKIKEYDKKTMSEIYDYLLNSPYIGMHLTSDIELLPFIKGLVSTVKPLVQLYGSDVPQYHGFQYLLDNFLSEFDELEPYGQYFDELAQNKI